MIEEWLVREDWCDVFLMCRGGVFNAHRTVLASVSPYLRCILISHSEQHSPIYIALPDFDWEIMSSVLYYVYNGEISVPIEHLSSFFDIINTLKIFIDKTILEKVKEYLKDINSEDFILNNIDHNKNMIKLNENSRNLVKFDFKSLRFTNFKSANQRTHKKLPLHIPEETSCNEAYILNSNKTQNQDKDRQNSLLRDPFTEMYSRNGNTDRPSPNVPTITNERYLELVSGEVMNGNNTIMETAPKTEKNCTNDVYLKKYTKCVNKNNEIAGDSTNVQILNSMFKAKKCKQKNYEFNKIKTNQTCESSTINTTKSQDWLDLSQDEQLTNELKVNDSSNSYRKNSNEDNKSVKTKRCFRDGIEVKVNLKKKKPPLNKVLASPWTPRLPRSYRPLKNKRRPSLENRNQQSVDDCETLSNDNNNNLSLVTNIPDGGGEGIENRLADSEHTQKRELKIAEIETRKCESEVSSSNEESEDSKKLSSRSRHTCVECGKSFSQLRNYKYHISVHRGTKEFAATCPVCGKYFNDRGYLSSHLKIHRNRKEYQCPHCPKSFNQRVAYNMHIRIHTGVKPHVCEQCGKAFSRKMLLKQHKRTHSGERPYACSFCDKRFADRSNMTLHMRLHSGVKPFACTVCPKSFTKKHHLKTHLNFHTGAKPYSCPRCSMAFSQSSNMRTHLKKCTAEASTT